MLAAACDYRVMTTGKGGIGVPEMLVGVPFPAAALAIVEHAAGTKRAREAALSGRIFPSTEALELGYVDELVDPVTVVISAVSHAYRLASTIPPDTFSLTKRHMRNLTESSIYDREVVRIWQQRAKDGWIADYMNRTVRRP